MTLSNKKRNSLYISNPELVKEWDYLKNVYISPEEVTKGSNKKVWWKCNNNHEWYARICDRVNGNSCPFCSQIEKSNKMIKSQIEMFGSLQDNNPGLAKEWNYSKNGKLTPSDVTPFSNKKVWWICSKGHEWSATINNRNYGTGCPYCAKKQIKEPLSKTHPLIAKEWNYEKNLILTPELITCGSNLDVWWKCNKGHEWEASPKNRTKDVGRGCPICSNHKIIVGINDLATTNPELAKEWNYEKNAKSGLTPQSIVVGSNKKVWWKCTKGHEWESIVANRRKGVGCPYCSKELRTSFPEQAIYYYFNIFFSDCINGDKETIAPSELDIYIPSLKSAIEYDGRKWHSSAQAQERDNKKNEKCNSNGIRLYRIRENGCAPLSDVDDVMQLYYEYGDYEKLGDIISRILFELTGLITTIDIEKDRQIIYTLLDAREKRKSVVAIKPSLLKEWDYEKNIIDPATIAAGSQVKVWWKCENGHSWQANIQNRIKGRRCPYCTNRKILQGFNDLASTNADLVKDWDYEKNGLLGVFPDKITRGSSKKVWWKCTKGHSWQATISSRTNLQGPVGCPYCSGLKLLLGFNDLATTNPELVNQWNYEKNGELLPSMVTKGQHRKVWWKCSNGHEWEDYLFNRVRGRKCPLCPKNYEYKGNNILSRAYPELIKEWNYEKNAPMSPDIVASRSGKKLWWICSKGHEWQATVADRTSGNRCPFCSGKRVIKGENDLATKKPLLANEWNYERNVGITPQDVKEHSNKKVWWKCSKGHEWEAVISSRATGCGCPYCSGRLPTVGENDLATLNPQLAQDWNYIKNGDLKPSDFTASSGKKVWWACQTCGNEWYSSIHSRSAGHGCPYCSNSKVMPGFNDLATINPLVASEWNYEKNNGLTPKDFTVYSGKRVWWICSNGHEWESTISNRTSGKGFCPVCRRAKNNAFLNR